MPMSRTHVDDSGHDTRGGEASTEAEVMLEAMPNDLPNELLDELCAIFGKRLKQLELLSRHGTFGVGGPADMWVTVTHEDELTRLVALASEHHIPLMLIGNGTNALFSDAGARGIVARMALADWRLEDVDAEHVRLIAGAGVSLPKLVNDLAAKGLAGLEWGAGVPGTIGGGIVSNAGAHGACIADTLQSARVLFTPESAPSAGTQPGIHELPAVELELGYRRSRFRSAREIAFDVAGRPIPAPRTALLEPTEMILGGTFLLQREASEAVRERVEHYKQHRRDTQPPQPSAGSVFKNPPGDFSGRLVEAAGLKGTVIGKAQISPKHANFIVNLGGATANDITGLIALARNAVLERFGIALELEVELRGDWE